MSTEPTTPATAVATIHRAAADMRDTAAAVTTVGHDWTIHPPEGDTEWTIGDGDGVRVAETPDYGGLELPDHIASWTPPIALLVADLLDAVGDDIEMRGAPRAEWAAAYNLAAAYLKQRPQS